MEVDSNSIKKKDRIVRLKFTQDDVQKRIKSDHSPFSRKSSTNSTSTSSSIAPKHVSSMSTETFNLKKNENRAIHQSQGSRYSSKNPYQEQPQLSRRACEDWERLIAPCRLASEVKPKTPRDKIEAAKGSKALMQASNISYNRTIIDHLERDRYTHPNYNVEHLISAKKKTVKIDARFEE